VSIIRSEQCVVHRYILLFSHLLEPDELLTVGTESLWHCMPFLWQTCLHHSTIWKICFLILDY